MVWITTANETCQDCAVTTANSHKLVRKLSRQSLLINIDYVLEQSSGVLSSLYNVSKSKPVRLNFLMLLILSGDIETNPGPRSPSGKPVREGH